MNVLRSCLKRCRWNVYKPDHVTAVVAEMNSSHENTIGDTFFSDFNYAIDTIENDYNSDVPLVLTSAWNNEIFSEGLDETWLSQIPDHGEEMCEKINDLFERLYLLERPTIAAVNGNAFGGGFILSLCCDFRFISPEYDVLTAAPKIGLSYPSSVYHIMRYEIPFYKKFMLTGDRISGDIAIRERISLKHRNNPLDDALDFVGKEIPSPKAFTNNKVSLKISSYQHFQETEGEEIDRKYISATQEPGIKEGIEMMIAKKKDL